jgi:glyceraldehyde 3-phosphate dehydrogenase
MSRVAIHGFGRIGHSLMKAALDGDVFVPVSISDIKDIETLAALFEVDSNQRTLVRAGRDKARAQKGRPVSSFGPPPQKPTRTFRHKASKIGGSAKTTAPRRGHTHDT